MDEDSWSFILNWKFKLILWLAGRAELRLDWLVKPPCVEQDMILKCYRLRAELRLRLVRKVSMRGARYDNEILWPAG